MIGNYYSRNYLVFLNYTLPFTFFYFDSFGAKYRYNESHQTFSFYEGEDLEVDRVITNPGGAGKSGFNLPVVYPETVYLVEGTHPEVFSANGSHGVWAAEG